MADKGVTVFRCPAGTEGIVDLPTWRETLGASAPDGRLLSVALDVRTDRKDHPPLDDLVDVLLRSRSVDQVYRIELAGPGLQDDPKRSVPGPYDATLEARVKTAISKVYEDMGPWIADSQLVWWAVGPEFVLIKNPSSGAFSLLMESLPKFIPPFSRRLGLGQRPDDGWVPAHVDLFRQAPTEQDLIKVWPGALADGEGAPTRLAALPAAGEPVEPRASELSPGTAFRDLLADGSQGPEMVVVPAGRFLMGSADSDRRAENDEHPQHEVTLPKPFAMGTHEVSFEEYDRFAKATGRPLPDDRGWGRGRQPVINVSFEDAQAYAEWLSNETGQTYRPPSEVEWEYAARAGTETAYWWGPEVGKNQANCNGCGSRWDSRQTAPVGSFAANPYGLYDTAGNVWEWVEDCYQENYRGAPADGRTWVDDTTCGLRVLRGGSWSDDAGWLRSASRTGDFPVNPGDIVGFRLTRTL